MNRHPGTGPRRPRRTHHHPGRRRAPVHLTYGHLRDLPSVTRTALVERAGNARGLYATRQGQSVSGATWRPARLHDAPRRGAWVRWSAPWRPGRTGPATLLSRTADTAGNTRPDRAVRNTRGHLLDAVVRHPVTVARTSRTARSFV